MQKLMKSMVNITNQRFLGALSKKLQKNVKCPYFQLCQSAKKM
tara:strand:- start:47 stop:175 length:129 start_codon:yes stop_codon:yes gene_type:complete